MPPVHLAIMSRYGGTMTVHDRDADSSKERAAQERAARLKAALRANLVKRKQHARDSASGIGEGEEPVPEA